MLTQRFQVSKRAWVRRTAQLAVVLGALTPCSVAGALGYHGQAG